MKKFTLVALALLALAPFVNPATPDTAEPAPKSRLAVASAYDPKTDKWMFGRRHHKTVCLEAHGTATKWPWLSVLVSYNKAGLNTFQRPPGGCSVVPSGYRVIVKTYAFYNGDKNNMWSEACALTLPWTYDGKIDYTEIWINLTRATAGHIACRSGNAFSSVAAHEFGHALGLDHTSRTDSVLHSDLRVAQPVDIYRLKYMYQGVPR